MQFNVTVKTSSVRIAAKVAAALNAQGIANKIDLTHVVATVESSSNEKHIVAGPVFNVAETLTKNFTMDVAFARV